MIKDKDGVETQIDLTEAGNVYGKLEKCRTETGLCEIKSVEIAGEGFEGTYGVPKAIENVLARRRRLGEEVSQGLIDHFENRRRLQASLGPKAKIFNPIYCIKENDSFLFSIEDPNHFPVYMKNSVLNTNAAFDFGAFQVLEEEMLRQKALGDLTPSIFSFTFPKKGSYVFTDAAND